MCCKSSALSPELITATVAVVALAVTVVRNYWEKQTVQRKLFAKFNRRFDKLNEKLNTIYDKVYQEPLTSREQNIIQDYLNLCAEEYLWHQKSLIDDDVWTAWHEGMLYYLKDWAFAEYFARERKRAPASYYGLFEELRWPVPNHKPSKPQTA